MASNDEATNANGGDQPSPDEASDTSTVGEAGRTEPSDPAPEHQEASPQPQPQPEPEVPAEAPAEASAEARPASQPPPYVPPTAQEPQVQAGGQAQPGAPAWSDLSPAGDDQSGAAPQSWDQQATQQWQQPTAPPPSGPQAPPAGSWTVPGSPPTMQQPIIQQPPVEQQPAGPPQQQYQQPQQQYQPQQYQQPQQQYQPQQYQQPYGVPQQPAAPTGPTRGGGPMALLGGLLLLLGGVALIVGSFLDWGEGLVGGQRVVLTGFKNAQDKLWGAPGTLAAGAVLVIAGVLYLASMKSGVGALKRTLALVGSLAGLGWVVYLLVSLQLDEANALIGLWLCLAGAVLGLVGTFLGRGKKQASRPKN
ncbi:MAG: hypothetical protein IPF42_16795 [Candidatus Microthrix sp.]|nr:hypothetical protein [Candidatus Microthrix sp.]MBK6312142.1 hypothetical protein [Candidatus Microthrix sp.]MBK9558633.1 hypothetical protein [Candidatus Microthrix sp.]